MKSTNVATNSLGLLAPWLAGLGDHVVVSREGDVVRIESTRIAAARAKLRKMTTRLQNTAAQAGMTNKVIETEVAAVRAARGQRALRR